MHAGGRFTTRLPGGTTMIYTHVLNCGGLGVRSPIDRISAPAMAAMPSQPSPASEPTGRPSPSRAGIWEEDS